MTRINVVPVEELSDQHLIAEYHELPRVIKQNIDISDAPDKYCLGKGHMKWARKHWRSTLLRYRDLMCEMEFRGFRAAGQRTYHFDLLHYCLSIPVTIEESWYMPKQDDIELNCARLVEKYRLKPNWYKWTNREKPSYYD